ncbi:hypothetical protein [Desulfoplanes sp.]
MSFFPKRCVEVLTGKVVSVSGGKRKFVILNKNKIPVRKVDIDDCLIEKVDGQMACDYGLWVEEKNIAYVVELKGMDVVHACRQIFETLKYVRKYHPEELEGKDIETAVVCSKYSVPKLKVHPAYVKLKKLVKRDPVIKIGQLEVRC